MEILKDLLSQMPMLLRIIIYTIGLIFWTWFVFFYTVNMSKSDMKSSSVVQNQTNIKSVKGDYVAGDKYVTEIHKSVFSTEEKKKLEKESDPLVSVKIEKADKELLIKIETKNHVNTLAFDIPILGKIINIHDNNSITDAQVPLKQITGSQTVTSQNNAEFLIENIKPNTSLSYKILFEPMPKGFYVAGSDRYKIAYTWMSGGEIFSREKWFSFDTGNEVEKPAVEVRGFSYTNRALTPEEIRKRYEQGLPKQKIE